MKAKMSVLILVVLSLLAFSLASASAQPPMGVSINCDNGASFDNGVEIIVNQMRAGFEYTATAVGLNGFDPVIAVINQDGDGLCNDDNADARNYAADLPTTGEVDASSLSAQVNFSHSDSSGFANISLVVGGLNNQEGEFILILEGMAATSADNSGDPFSVRLTPLMVDSGVPLTVYMLTRGQSGVDPFLYRTDSDGNIIEDEDGNPLACDDAGTDLCYGNTTSLDNYSVTIATGTLPGWQYDAYLEMNIEDLELDDDADFNFFNLMMTSYGESEGQYLLVFHVGVGEGSSGK